MKNTTPITSLLFSILQLFLLMNLSNFSNNMWAVSLVQSATNWASH